MNAEFIAFPKIPRLSREIIVTEKLDGTNGQIYITNNLEFYVGSRSRWIVPGDDNFGFAKWAHENKDDLMQLGPGSHFGEWWGKGIQRNYGLDEKRFSLFNVARWGENRPNCCNVVPILYKGPFNTAVTDSIIEELRAEGSVAAPGFNDPEGIIIYHTASQHVFKKTIKDDESPKGQ